MKSVFWKMCVVVGAAAVSAGCGGGGGGGGAATAMSLSVAVNGAARSPDSGGRISVAPGDQVQITPNQPAQWTAASAAGSSITLRNGSAAPSAWSGQIVNDQPTAGSYTLTANSSANASVGAAITFAVSAGDTRNGKYQVFSTNGTRQQLALNFDVKSYDMTDDASVTVSGDIAANANAETGTWNFVNPRGTAATTARFRVTTDTVVGGFPFAKAFASPVAYAVQPFVASRAPVTSQAAIDGVYNRVGITLTASGMDSAIQQMRISNGGTRADVCNDSVVSTVAACTTLLTYQVKQGDAPGRWELFNSTTGADSGGFAIATIGGRNVYLVAGKSVAQTDARLFRIGVVETASVSGGVARGSDNTGAWGTTTIVGSSLSSSGTAAGGGALNPLALTLGPANVSINGLRVGRSGTNGYFVLQGAKIGAVVGARNNLVTQGYLQIGLLDD